jgi:hypothetical protein
VLDVEVIGFAFRRAPGLAAVACGVDVDAVLEVGWSPCVDTRAALAELARRGGVARIRSSGKSAPRMVRLQDIVP